MHVLSFGSVSKLADGSLIVAGGQQDFPGGGAPWAKKDEGEKSAERWGVGDDTWSAVPGPAKTGRHAAAATAAPATGSPAQARGGHH